ncbi:MAG: peroxide stress protein YaaA, partial [Rickettsiales bacterium]
MLALLSPSKTLDFETPPPIASSDQPLLLHRSEELIEELQRYSEADIGKLMKISDKLAALNYERFQHFSTPFTPDNAKPA